MCLLGSVVIVLHAPPDKPVERIDEMLAYAVKARTFAPLALCLKISF